MPAAFVPQLKLIKLTPQVKSYVRPLKLLAASFDFLLLISYENILAFEIIRQVGREALNALTPEIMLANPACGNFNKNKSTNPHVQ